MRQGTENQRIRTAAKEAGIYLWQIAYALGMNDGDFSKKLRRPLSPEDENKVLSIIAEIKEERRKA